MSIFGDIDAIRKDQENWRAFAKETFIPGIDPADLKVGMKVTISPNLRIHDRSYTDSIHTVVGVNSTHVQTRPERHWSDRPVLLLLHEHHFYDASNFETMAADA